ncbi:hypothetical protein JW968_06530 [Candidatus Woesearchaeota archaeon]|nr:hypothetical protein [Candidatus Woesearchaeota archaeon]
MRFSGIEIKHLAISWAAITMAFTIVMLDPGKGFLVTLLHSALAVGTGFVFHELGHKLVAQRYGCWAEYRADFRMLFFAIIISFTGFLFAAPGAVLIHGNVDKARNGKISMAGPLTNILIAVIFLAISFFSQGILQSIALFGTQINAWLALFNMLPFGNFDGRKIFAWNRAVYFSMIICAAVLLFPFFLA